ncbi:MAG TPA: hypothetical protein VL944_01735 [Candidatus Acidoferrum sp.]|nr:hypothetical protein [Candidatus Acidoferrum sp.]
MSSEGVRSIEKSGQKAEAKSSPNPISVSAKLEASEDYKGAISVIEAEVRANPNSILLPSYLNDLLRRKHIHDLRRNLQYQ